jgi:hypothetical protein
VGRVSVLRDRPAVGCSTAKGRTAGRDRSACGAEMAASDHRRADDATATRHGTYTVIGGTGKYAGVKGDGTWSGAGGTAQNGAISYIDAVVNLRSGDEAQAAKAMLERAHAAIKKDREVALAQFTKGEAGFKDGDLYVFCNRLSDGLILAGPTAIPAGTDGKTLVDVKGFPLGKALLDAAASHPEGVMTEVSY